MSPLNLAGIAIGVLAVIVLCFGASDGWFFGLLCLASMAGSMGEAYRENKPGAIAFLIVAALFALLSVRAAYLDSRHRGDT
ncbi:hypothetical protein [Streptomyces sp. NPDC044948]|uniref:hypothetical protein n=1 Tax=Streptomyces sp. NPDC044948 TaxID=3157092 RepID=UPI0034011459